jgi:tRNA pseudouridine55 synthase
MDGILAVWKPAGWTSHDVVAKARRLLREKRIGHAGTLDPQVTGVLPLCIGRATRVVEYIQDLPKSYDAVIQLGTATDTEDLTGTVIEEIDRVDVTEAQIRDVLASFTGEIEQVPPMYSAVKVEGKRLYELAREGKTIERKSRKVTIYDIRLTSLALDLPYPRFAFSVTCSKGTYIRTLCVDIGRALGVPATMAELIRTMSAGFTEAQCLTLEQIEALQQEDRLQERLLPAESGLSHMEKVTTGADTAQQALQGRKITLDAVSPMPAESGMLRLYSEDDRFIGIYEADLDKGILRPIKVFS